jgi:hypothetical protein
MEGPPGLPDDIDPELWFECAHHPGERDYIVREPWQTFPGRIHAWCQKRQVSFRVSKVQMPDKVPTATRYWVDGFLIGNTPRQPVADDFDDPAVVAWRSKVEQFLVDGVWPQMSDLKRQWFEDAQALADIGRALEGHEFPTIRVRLPVALADRAVAAWMREDEAEPDESPSERIWRQRAGVLALIGLAVQERGAADGDGVEVALPADLVANAIDAIEAS